MNDFGFTNDVRQMEAAENWRVAAIADGWAYEPMYPPQEAVEVSTKLRKEGWVAHVITRNNPGPLWQYQAEVSVWGPDGLWVNPGEIYNFENLQANLRYCMYCGSHDVDTQRVSFAGRCCVPCLEAQRKISEFPGWTK